jgi:radical SAM superfamily enzyme YgiQ (UPF0313 family)
MMKILLISPCRESEIKTPKGVMVPQLSLQLLAAITPSEHEVIIREEEIENINLDEECDVVGITCMTANAPRAYYYAEEFKKRGRTIVMGGVHPSILPDEALKFSDSVVIGEAEDIWGKVLKDFGNGKLQKKYFKPSPSLDRYIPVNHNSAEKRRLFNIIPVMTTRGCPYNCDFCCVSGIFGSKIRHVPVENVIRELVESAGKKFLFLDDNIIGDPRYAKELFRAMKPLNIRWVGQASISFASDTDLIKLAAESGCNGLFMGFESVSVSQLKTMRKSVKELKMVEEAINKIHSFGISILASLIFGFDGDTKQIFSETLEFLNKNRIGLANFNVLTPYPGTKLYRRFKEERRLLTSDWRCYDNNTVVFKPKNMTPLELQAGRIWTTKQYTRIGAIMTRLLFHLNHPLMHVSINLGSRQSCKNEIKRFPKLISGILRPENKTAHEAEKYSLRSFKFSSY